MTNRFENAFLLLQEDSTNTPETIKTAAKAMLIIFFNTFFESSTPAFSDVKSDSNIFPYVQACCEWDVLEAGGL